MSRPRFTVNEHENRVSVYDDDFGFDAGLRISGDFVDDEKKRFAQAIADVLNENASRIPTADSMRAGLETCAGCGKRYPQECDWCSDTIPRPGSEP